MKVRPLLQGLFLVQAVVLHVELYNVTDHFVSLHAVFPFR